ncbi:MAG: calcium/sodium antiporter, partial [Bryobacterales bacterium]|nr:calcium/sodium antiporter [Bryobacterales bacterium]
MHLIAGLLLLIGGAELLVRGASRMAAFFGVSPLVIGLTVVAFGTSSPELAVSIGAAWSGSADLAVGNVVGSNIFNVLLILGLSAAIIPLAVAQQLVRIDVPLMIGASVLLLLLSIDGMLGRGDGVLLLGGGLGYVVLNLRLARRESKAVALEYTKAFPPPAKTVGTQAAVDAANIAGGLAMLYFGSEWLVHGAVVLARAWGVSELIIGLTIVSAGTSMPEVATSVMAAIRGERDIAVGNVIGSNIFNILYVLGISGIVAPKGVPVSLQALEADMPIMIAVAFACFPVFFRGVIGRWEGAVFLAYYVAYVGYLVLHATGHDLLPVFKE